MTTRRQFIGAATAAGTAWVTPTILMAKPASAAMSAPPGAPVGFPAPPPPQASAPPPSEPSEVYHVHEHVYRCQDCGQMADAVPDLSSELERYREALERIVGLGVYPSADIAAEALSEEASGAHR